MRVQITYITKKTKEKRTKVFIKESLEEALRYFKWRYGHQIVECHAA
jgi:hypothetical protein